MGNYLVVCVAAEADNKVLQIVKADGKVLEFRSSVLVRDLLASYPNFYVGIFKEATQPLPLDYRLKIGKIYYLLPPLDAKRGLDHHVESREADKRGKRIKVVITKEQLQQLIAKQGGLDELLLEVNDPKKDCGFHHGSAWSPKLESIPEGSEVVS